MRFNNWQRLLFEEADPDGTGASILGDVAPPAEAAPPKEPEAAAEWLAGVDPEYASHSTLQHVPDLGTLVKNYVNAQKMIGKDKLVLPDEHATEDDLNLFYDKLGRPSREEYKIDFGESGYDEKFQAGLMDAAHKAGVLPNQAQGMFDFFQSQVDSANDEYTNQTEAQSAELMEGLKAEWGNGFDKNVSIAKTAVDTLTDDSFKAFLNESGLGNHPTMIKMFTAIGSQLNEDTFDRKTVKNLGMTKEEAQERINSVMSDDSHPYWNAQHANSANAKADMAKWMEITL